MGADVDAAPSRADSTAHLVVRLPAATRLYENVRSVSGGLLLAALAWAVAYPLLPPAWGFRTAVVGTVLAAIGVAADVVLNGVQQRSFILRVVPRGVEMERGRCITTSMLIVPGAVLSVDVHVGPFLRRLGLVRLRLNGIAPLPEIPPLAEADGRAVQRLLIRQLSLQAAPPGDAGAPWSP